MTLLGYFFGKSWDLLEQYIKGAGFVMAGAVVILIVGFQLYKRRKRIAEARRVEAERAAAGDAD
jgi:membrane protein DedA with SNARE-associated domain